MRKKNCPLLVTLQLLEIKHGGLRPAARVIGITPSHFLRVRRGEREAGPKLCKKLGLRQIISYEKQP